MGEEDRDLEQNAFEEDGEEEDEEEEGLALSSSFPSTSLVLFRALWFDLPAWMAMHIRAPCVKSTSLDTENHDKNGYAKII